MASSNEICCGEESSGFSVCTALGASIAMSAPGCDSDSSVVVVGSCGGNGSTTEAVDTVSALPPLFLRFWGGGGLMTKLLGLMTPFARNTTSRHRLQSSSSSCNRNLSMSDLFSRSTFHSYLHISKSCDDTNGFLRERHWRTHADVFPSFTRQ